MAQHASIFIPDISGYTDFLSRTEIEHSAHILNDLLKLLVDSNAADLTLLEIEGDSLLFYRKGDPLPFDEMVRQCVSMFVNFHTRLKIIERDSVCRCGACQTATNLTLKFVVHYGEVSEISVSSFVKASGIDMVIAHRLLKNRIESHEYILATEGYLSRLSEQTSTPEFAWHPSSEEYPVVGAVPFRYALLSPIRRDVTVPPRPPLAVLLEDGSLSIDIHAPMDDVYRIMTDLEGRKDWISGLQESTGEDPLDRLHSVHFCHFQTFTVEIVPLEREIGKDHIRYVESGKPVGTGEKALFSFELVRKDRENTTVTLKIGSDPACPLEPGTGAELLDQMKATLASLKEFIERNHAGSSL